jgi:hypothetical protein
VFVIVAPIVIFSVGREVFLWLRDRDRSPFNGYTLILFVSAAVAMAVVLPWLTHMLVRSR